MKTWLRIGVTVAAAVLLVIAVVSTTIPANAGYTGPQPGDVTYSSYRGACGGSCMNNDGDEDATCPNYDNGACYGNSSCSGGGMMGSGITGRSMMGRGNGITRGGGASCH